MMQPKSDRSLEFEDFEEASIVESFLDSPDEQLFSEVFAAFSPRILRFLRARLNDAALAEDLTQDVMLTAYRKAHQVRDRALFRSWLFTIARNALYRHFCHTSRNIRTVDLSALCETPTAAKHPEGPPAFEFLSWMAHLQPREREIMHLRFVEEWEYHEISAAKAIPIGTVQWMVFNSKKKLRAILGTRRAA